VRAVVSVGCRRRRTSATPSCSASEPPTEDTVVTRSALPLGLPGQIPEDQLRGYGLYETGLWTHRADRRKETGEALRGVPAIFGEDRPTSILLEDVLKMRGGSSSGPHLPPAWGGGGVRPVGTGAIYLFTGDEGSPRPFVAGGPASVHLHPEVRDPVVGRVVERLPGRADLDPGGRPERPAGGRVGVRLPLPGGAPLRGRGDWRGDHAPQARPGGVRGPAGRGDRRRRRGDGDGHLRGPGPPGRPRVRRPAGPGGPPGGWPAGRGTRS
jgi:hypothetical protein